MCKISNRFLYLQYKLKIMSEVGKLKSEIFSVANDFIEDSSDALDCTNIFALIVEKHAIGFAEFIDNNCTASNNTDDKYILNDFIPMDVEFTRNELFQLYIQSLK